MAVIQRQIVEVPFNLPQGVLNHPAIILSVTEAIEVESAFIGVMVTSEKIDDEFTFELRNDMLQSGSFTKGYCEVRLHLISFFRTSEIISNRNRNMVVKKDDFDRIVKQIIRITFGQK